jgi:threonine dehydratase
VHLYLKAELFQKTGSFKVRGVVNKLDQLSEPERRRGLVSMSAGNHAAALAWAAAACGSRATIVMPAGAVPAKVEATRGYGGEVVRTEDDLMQVVDELRRSRGLVPIHPYDDLDIMAGHASCGLEILEDVPDVELILVPVGGGGLIGGVAAAVKLRRPGVRVVGVEPEGADVMWRSLAEGQPVSLSRRVTVADGLAAPCAGEHNLRHAQRFVDEVVRVPDEAILEALRRLLTRSKLAAEPAGAASLAALLGPQPARNPGTRVVCVVSGGNVDPALLKRVL